MGCTLAELGERMTAQEFGLHLALDEGEPMPAAQHQALGTLMAAIANGALKAPQGRLWNASDFIRSPWAEVPEAPPPPAAPQTVDEILARFNAVNGGGS